MLFRSDVKANGLDALAERAVAMARAAPDDQFAGLADPALLRSEACSVEEKS